MADIDDDTKILDDNKFDFRATRVFLTYPQSLLNKETILDNAKKWGAVQWIIGEEKHADGKNHFHCYFKFNKELHTANSRYFDIPIAEHPNIRTIKKDAQSVMEYCMKGADYIEGGVEMFKNSKGFKRKKVDQDDWFRYIRNKNNTEPQWPITLPDGKTEANGPGTKKRHWWITGPPDFGKTEWTERTFEGKRIFKRVAGAKYPFDNYQEQQVIIYDDVMPKFEEISAVSNVYLTDTPVYGNTRYGVIYWKKKQERVMFILSNEEPYWFKPDSKVHDACEARFNWLDLRE